MKQRDHFLLLVQTGLLARYGSESQVGNPKSRGVWAVEHMDDAVKVAENLVGDVTALEAANAFMKWAFQEHEHLTDDEKTILDILL